MYTAKIATDDFKIRILYHTTEEIKFSSGKNFVTVRISSWEFQGQWKDGKELKGSFVIWCLSNSYYKEVLEKAVIK